MSLITKVALLLAGLYLAIVLLMYFYQHHLIFRPYIIKPEPKPQYADMEIVLNRDNVDLHGWFLNRGKERPLIIYYGGNSEDISTNLANFYDLDYPSFLLMEYRGYGKSGGRPTEKHLLEDALSILDTIAVKEGLPIDRIILMGRSLGSGVATYVASQRNVGGVILASPYDSLENVAQRHYPFVPVRWMLKHRFESIVWAPDISTPGLFIIANGDRVVPNKHTQVLMHAWRGPTQAVHLDHVSHAQMNEDPGYWRGIKEFVSKFHGDLIN